MPFSNDLCSDLAAMRQPIRGIKSISGEKNTAICVEKIVLIKSQIIGVNRKM